MVGARRGAPETPDPPPLETQPRLLHRIAGRRLRVGPVRARRGGRRRERAAGARRRARRRRVGRRRRRGLGRRGRRARRRRRRPARAARGGHATPGARSASSRSAARRSARPTASRTSRPCRARASAWAALVPYADRGRTNAKAQVARIDAATGATTVESLPAAGSGRGVGGADRVHLGRPTAGWSPTPAGCSTTPTGRGRRRTPTRRSPGPITSRPNEAAEQFVPDTAPVDDSQLFAPPPVAIETAPDRGARSRSSWRR